MNIRPGGKAPVYLAHVLLKSVAVGSAKYNKEEHGFDGFGIRMEIIKSRSNQAGQTVDIVYDKVRGIDPLRTCLGFAKECGLIGGNKNATYFINNKDMKFPMASCTEFFKENREMYKIMYDHILPVLETKLSSVTTEEIEYVPESMDY